MPESIYTPFSQVDTIYWTGVDCPDCQTVTVCPVVASNYSVTVIFSLGCRATDDLTTNAAKDLRMFVPSVFSPDGDGQNDYFSIYTGPDVESISEFRIFSRCGEIVFHTNNTLPNIATLGGMELSVAWRGSSRIRVLGSIRVSRRNYSNSEG